MIASAGPEVLSSGISNHEPPMKLERSEVTVSSASWKMIITIVPVLTYEEGDCGLIAEPSGYLEAIWICTDGTSGKVRADNESHAIQGCLESHGAIWPHELN